MKIYGDIYSGNCYKLKLMCALLGLEHEWVPIDITRGETRSDSFLAINPNGQIPVCVTDNGEVLTESNAILFYLAQGSSYWPADSMLQTRVLEWQCFEQYTHEPTIAVARFIKVYQGLPEDRKAEYESKLKSGYRALDLMENHLKQHDFLVGESCSIADIFAVRLYPCRTRGRLRSIFLYSYSELDYEDKKSAGLHCHARSQYP